MSKSEIEELFAQFKDCISGTTIHGNVIINMNSGNTENNLHGNEVVQPPHQPELKMEQEKISAVTISKALNKCKSFIWGNAAYAVAFCVCRDLFGWQDNASLFERELLQQGIELPPGTINTTISRNPYMRLDIGKWDSADVMERSLKLRDELCNQIHVAEMYE